MSAPTFLVREHVVLAQHIREYPGATSISQEEGLKLHIKQYVPTGQGEPPAGAITLVATHANGFPKELYEPLWIEILDRSKGKFNIRSIWIADVVHQGQSYALNEHILSNDPSWYDHSRDLLHIINVFRAEMPRPIVGIGHSWGGTQLVNLAIMHPRLLTALILLDPVIELGKTTDSDPATKESHGIATTSTHRRDLWPSRQDARASFARNPFYQRWDHRVFDRLIHYGLRDIPTAIYPDKQAFGGPDSAVTLTTPKHQEVWTYLRPNFHGCDEQGNENFNRERTPDISPGTPNNYPFYRPESSATFHKLPFLRPPTLYVLGHESNISTPEVQRDKVKLTGVGTGGSGGISEGWVKDIILPGISHLVPMEAPGATAQESVNWLQGVMREWHKQEESWRNKREVTPKAGHLIVSKEWIHHVGFAPGRNKTTKVTKL